MQLTKNFSLDEFTNELEIPDYRLFLVQGMANILQTIRNVLCCSIQITSGMRSQADFDRLRKAGYNPSETSDHNYGLPIMLDSSNPKFRTFGAIYNFSVGAADIVPDIGAENAWKQLEPLCDREQNLIVGIRIGQFILEKGLPGATPWIHVSNHPEIAFSRELVRKFLNRPCFLTSVDGGKTYQPL